MNNEPLALSGMRKPLLSVSGKGRISAPRALASTVRVGVSCGRCRAIDKSGAPK